MSDYFSRLASKAVRAREPAIGPRLAPRFSGLPSAGVDSDVLWWERMVAAESEYSDPLQGPEGPRK